MKITCALLQRSEREQRTIKNFMESCRQRYYLFVDGTKIEPRSEPDSEDADLAA